MATEEGERESPVAERVAVNVATLRESRRLSVRGLSARLGELGRPILPSGVTKIEQCRRRVDADDLVALALALDVTPNRLLLPPVTGEKTALTPDVECSSATAWAWACGDDHIPDMWAERPEVLDLNRGKRFRVENRPHDPGSSMSLDEMQAHEDTLATLGRGVADARAAGLTLEDVQAYVRLADTMRRVGERLRECREEGR